MTGPRIDLGCGHKKEGARARRERHGLPPQRQALDGSVRAEPVTRDVRFRRRATLALGAAALALGFRLYFVRFHLDFLDESAEITAAWLVSEGETLYGSVFSHHMPLPVMAGHLVAAISPTDRAEHFRVVPFLAYLLAAFAIARSPFERARPGIGRLAAALFLFALAVIAPCFWGHMLLADSLWGCAFLVATVSFLVPLLLGLSPTRWDAALAGACLVIAVSGSLVAAYPCALAGILGAAALLDRRRRRLAVSLVASFTAGAMGALAVFTWWLSQFGELDNFLEETVRFNRDVYYRFTFGEAKILPSVLYDWERYVREAPEHILHGDLDSWFLVLAFVAVFAIAWGAVKSRSHETGSRALLGFEVLIWCAAVVSLRVRNGGFHGFPFYLAVLGVLCVVAAYGFANRSFRSMTVFLALTLGPAFLFAALDRPSWSNPSAGGWESGPFGAAARYVRDNSREDERFAAFPFPSSLYLYARRRPAADSIYYFPWQEAWEAERPGHPSACTQLRNFPPHFVFLWPVPLWDRFQWGTGNWGVCIDGFIKEHYSRVQSGNFAGLLWELRPGESPPH
ncbi:MAG: hypothetical protein NEA02_13135 [Thermoanaerobaculia bacterium]|nr:hypothetical protein [Thermoanaerobaculia bacterium]